MKSWMSSRAVANRSQPSNSGRYPLYYEARPTRQFGSYTLWVAWSDATFSQIDQGSPQGCIAAAERLNAALPGKAGKAAEAR